MVNTQSGKERAFGCIVKFAAAEWSKVTLVQDVAGIFVWKWRGNSSVGEVRTKE